MQSAKQIRTALITAPQTLLITVHVTLTAPAHILPRTAAPTPGRAQQARTAIARAVSGCVTQAMTRPAKGDAPMETVSLLARQMTATGQIREQSPMATDTTTSARHVIILIAGSRRQLRYATTDATTTAMDTLTVLTMIAPEIQPALFVEMVKLNQEKTVILQETAAMKTAVTNP